MMMMSLEGFVSEMTCYVFLDAEWDFTLYSPTYSARLHYISLFKCKARLKQTGQIVLIPLIRLGLTPQRSQIIQRTPRSPLACPCRK